MQFEHDTWVQPGSRGFFLALIDHDVESNDVRYSLCKAAVGDEQRHPGPANPRRLVGPEVISSVLD